MRNLREYPITVKEMRSAVEWAQDAASAEPPSFGGTTIAALSKVQRLLAPVPDDAKITPDDLEAVIEEDEYFVSGTLTIYVLTLVNGFKVTGEAAAASLANFDAELGKKLSRARAKEKIWALEGYLLRQRIFENGVAE